MKANRIFLLCSAIALPQLAMAEPPGPQTLGTVRAIVDFCSSVDPQDAAFFQAEWKNVVVGAADKQLDGAQSSGEYKQAFDSITAELGKRSTADVVAACAAGAADWRKIQTSAHGRDEVNSVKRKDDPPQEKKRH